MGPSVGVARPELGGLCDGCLNADTSTVGDGRLEIGVNMVDGREIEDGFTGSSLLPPDNSVENRTTMSCISSLPLPLLSVYSFRGRA